MQLQSLSQPELSALVKDLKAELASYQAKQLKLDLTRGKPSSDQLALSDQLDGILAGDYKSEDGTDCRNYGGLTGIPEIKRVGAAILGLETKEILAGGNASLTLMYQTVQHAHQFGFFGPESAWHKNEQVKFLCPVPGYDRHFTICEEFGIEMIPVPMTSEGPDMAVVESLVKQDASIKGIWCVPKYSNPTGVTYSDAIVKAIAELPKIASENFFVFWDNAYAVHDLTDVTEPLANIGAIAKELGTFDQILQFCSTSKITHAGAGVAFLGASEKTLTSFTKSLQAATIGPDKINQLRHARFLPDLPAVTAHMQRHAQLLRPRFELVLQHLQAGFAGTDLGSWETPKGGYFIAFDTRPGLAQKVVKMAADTGVKLTPAGATFPYGQDPEDKNIRLAPSVPSLPELDEAMKVFVLCVKLASAEQALAAL